MAKFEICTWTASLDGDSDAIVLLVTESYSLLLCPYLLWYMHHDHLAVRCYLAEYSVVLHLQ